MDDLIQNDKEGANDASALLDAMCPNCMRKLKVPVQRVGFKIRCPVCKGAFRVRGPFASLAGNQTVTELPVAGRAQSRPGGYGAAPKPGEVFANRFTIIRKLGTGTFGTVYHAFDDKDYCDVALKVPSEDILINPHFRERFRAEARTLECMQHPNIISFYDAELETPPRFLVAEFVNGRDLEQQINLARRTGRWIECDDVLWIVERLARALHHAHLKHVIHRDVKPANVMISGDVVKLMDFGLARFGDPSMTLTGAKIGTPSYMSPEQISGDPKLVDARSDQFALGVVLYELLCHQRPFDAPTAEGVYMKIVNETPPSPAELDRTIPNELSEICLRAIAKDPAARWPDCHAFAAALRSQISGDHRSARGHGTASVEEPPAATGARSSEAPSANETLRKLGSTVIDPVTKGLKPVASRISETLKKGRTTIEPIAAAVEPLTNALGTTVRISSRTIRTSWPTWAECVNWMQSVMSWLTYRVEQFNETLREIESISESDAEDRRASDGASGSSSATSDLDTTFHALRVSLASPPRSSCDPWEREIPVASVGGIHLEPAPPVSAKPAGTPAKGSQATSQAGDPGLGAYLEAVNEEQFAGLASAGNN